MSQDISLREFKHAKKILEGDICKLLVEFSEKYNINVTSIEFIELMYSDYAVELKIRF